MQWPAAALGGQKPAVHERVRMIAGKNDRAVYRYVVEIGDIDATKESVADSTNQPNDEALQHRCPYLALRSSPLCDVVLYVSIIHRVEFAEGASP